MPPFSQVLKTKYFVNVELVFSRPTVAGYFINQHRDFRNWRTHSIDQTELKRQGDALQAFCPVGLDLPVFNLLRACNDLCKPLPLDSSRDPIFLNSHDLTLRSKFWQPGRRHFPHHSGLGRYPQLFQGTGGDRDHSALMFNQSSGRW